MKILVLFITILFSTINGFSQNSGVSDLLNLFKSKNKAKNAGDSAYPITGAQFHAEDMGLNNMINYAIEGFGSIKGGVDSWDDYGTGGNTYRSTYCLKGASKCVLNFNDLGKTMRARFGASSIGWEEASAGFDSLYAMIQRQELLWGKNREDYGFDNGSGKMAEFSADVNNEGADKYKYIQVRIETIYIREGEYQLVLSVKNTR